MKTKITIDFTDLKTFQNLDIMTCLTIRTFIDERLKRHGHAKALVLKRSYDTAVKSNIPEVISYNEWGFRKKKEVRSLDEAKERLEYLADVYQDDRLYPSN